MSGTALVVVVAILGAGVVAVGVAVVLIYREQRRARVGDPTARSVADALRAGQDERALNELLTFLEALNARVRILGEHAHAVDETLESLTERSQAHLQRIGVARFDASDSVSGRLSSALAILDGHDTGFLITTLYDLERSRTFVRAIKAGRADRELLDEERQALDMAMRGGLSADTATKPGGGTSA